MHYCEGKTWQTQKRVKVLHCISIHTTVKVMTRITILHLRQVLFQFTPLRRWGLILITVFHVVRDFNPHHREGDDFDNTLYTQSLSSFNLHHCEGDDIHRYPAIPDKLYFNPHHREGGDPTWVWNFFPNWVFQSTPPRRWWLKVNTLKEMFNRISIHTTAKVVTMICTTIFWVDGISIHTTAKVVTHPPRESTHGFSISIHTTAKVVTRPFSVGHLR